jgi:hypothetical protein
LFVILPTANNILLLQQITSLFTWLINHQSAVIFSRNKPATINQPSLLFSQIKPVPAISQTTRYASVINHEPKDQGGKGPDLAALPSTGQNIGLGD